MSLRKTIKKILKEEENKEIEKSMLKMVKHVLDKQDPNRKYVCGYELSTSSFHGENKYAMFIYFNSGPNSPLWPKTMAVRDGEERIMNEIQDYLLNFFDQYVVMYSKEVKC